jgi:hypothetical protein
VFGGCILHAQAISQIGLIVTHVPLSAITPQCVAFAARRNLWDFGWIGWLKETPCDDVLALNPVPLAAVNTLGIGQFWAAPANLLPSHVSLHGWIVGKSAPT